MKLNQSEKVALQYLINYTIEEELRHYEESGEPKDHIYLKILRLQLAMIKNKKNIIIH